MYSYKKAQLPKKTIELSITIPWADIAKEYDSSFEVLRKDLKAEGFRKGKVPKNIAEKKIQKDTVYDHLLRAFVSRVYSEILKKEDIKPIISPKVELKKAKENEDWELIMTTAETPEIVLGEYKEAIKKATDEVKKDDIWVPGKDKEPSKEEKEKQESALFQAKLSAVLDTAKVEISDIIIEEEVNKKLSKLVDDVQKVGLTMESYLSSRNTTQEKLKNQMQKEINDAYKMEFVLQKIADDAEIQVSKEDIDKLIDNLKDPKDKEAAQQNMYYYASLMRKQKTLDYINSL
ncbi:hypothetical protein COY16_00070 [Candidatus Roizmanbacteria bacterium CG_4_10_14_0_2_um_filter_39_13]|uniref:Trigger factor n=1 Tax=Candidatus Roizmanbacteria bacterium CG_4_10_14_0_2_um_filter_39_13 TaxID=1974825 RepID=A0A2M7U2D5_9BACT|nr:MAG: hypothetical protein COY16_00070 [Candidatus Roizmanbacteria bacterium CG_4_10_14_0_2_um_filter_39_13]